MINIADGRSFGKITDLKLEFPRGTLKGIVVNDGRKSGILGFFCKNEIFIDEKNIIRIGGDAILVNIKNCAAITPTSVDLNSVSNSGGKTMVNQKPAPCPPPCPPLFTPDPPPSCSPPVSPCGRENAADIYFGDENGGFDEY